MVSETPPFGAGLLILSLFCSSFLYIPFCFLFFRNRNVHPINARLPRFVMALNFNVYVVLTNELLVSLFPSIYICAFREFLVLVPYMSLCSLYNYRLLHLLFANEITSEARRQKEEGGKNLVSESFTENTYVKYRRIVTSTYASWFIFLQSLFFLGIVGVLVILDPTTWNRGCDFMSWYQKLFRILAPASTMTSLCISILLLLMLRSARGDAYWLKSGFTLDVYTTGLSQIIYGALLIIGFPRWVSAIFVMFSMHCLFWTGTIWPYVLSEREQRRAVGGHMMVETESRAVLKDNLKEVLKNPDAFQTFFSYLETEFSTENLLFWEAVENLKNLDPNDNSLLNQIHRIYAQYCKPNAVYQINISAEDRKSLSANLATLSRFKDFTLEEKQHALHIFDEPQRIIYDLMNNDSYPRFLRSYEEFRLRNTHTGGSALRRSSNGDISLSPTSTPHLTPQPTVAEIDIGALFEIDKVAPDPHISYIAETEIEMTSNPPSPLFPKDDSAAEWAVQ